MATGSEQANLIKLKSLKTFRSSVKGQMTKIITYVNSNPDANDIEGFTSRLKRSKELLQQFCDTEQAIFELDPDETPKLPDFSDSFYEAEAKLSKLIRIYNSESLVDNSTNHNMTMIQNASLNQFSIAELKLPKLQLPEFHGEYRKWLPFYDFFVKTIHENPNLSSVQKFKYLKGALKGNAESLLRHISITDANYTDSFKKLCQRFDRKKYIVNDFIENFCNQAKIKNATAENIRDLMDLSDETLRGLKSLGKEGESRDPWLLHILINKLDEETRILWAQESAQIDFPTTQEFLDFLLKRFDTLESLKSCPKMGSGIRDHTKATKSHLTQEYSSVTPLCFLCEKSAHKLYDCSAFLNMNTTERRQLIKSANKCFNCLNGGHAVYQCSSKRRCHQCSRKHHTLLHIESTTSNNSSVKSTKTHLIANETSDNELEGELVCTCKVQNNDAQSTSNLHVRSSTLSALIPTALVNVVSGEGSYFKGRMLLDSGSLASFVSEKFVKRLNITRRKGRISIEGLGSTKVGITKGMVELHVKSIYDDNKNMIINAYVVSKITSKLPEISIDKSKFNHLNHLQLADPYFNKPKDIDILLSVQHVFQILQPGQIKGRKGQPSAQETSFGWIVGGELDQVESNPLTFTTSSSASDLDYLLKRFWEIEELQTIKKLSDSDILCENSFIQNKTIQNGHYQVKLLFKNNRADLGDTYHLAASRLRAMERRFTRDKSFKKLYVDFMTEYENLGHMRPISNTRSNKTGYILPHHGVIKENSSSTKLRVVFDASAKSSTGVSLNDLLLVGPTVQSSLYDIILRFRRHQIVFSADIEKMYRQVYIHPSHHQYQRILWRNDESHPIQIFELTTVTYGTACAPFLATRVLKQLAIENNHLCPKAAEIIQKDIYVDDLMSGANSVENAKILQSEILKICAKAGLTFRKWVSNNTEMLQNIPEDSREKLKVIEDNGTSAVKVLGLNWDPAQDIFCFIVNLNPLSDEKVTKRMLLSEVSKIFDPIGWLSPCIIRFKILFQKLWLKPLSWDDKLPSDINSEWCKMREELIGLELVKIPRWLQLDDSVEIQFHGFCDASNNAYAAAVYTRVTRHDGNTVCNLITAKSRVAPLKQVSLARLELCGALMLANLMSIVEKAIGVKVKMWAWTDSTIVLDWLSDHPKRWPTFVANRTAEILRMIPRHQWRHVNSKDNPADCASRGISPKQLNNHILWWNGPAWIICNEELWPKQKAAILSADELCNSKSLISLASSPSLSSSSSSSMLNSIILQELIEKFSNFYTLLHVVCYILRLMDKCKKRDVPTTITISISEINNALQILCKEVQLCSFETEIRQLKSKKDVHIKGPIKFLNPFLDDVGLLRVGGRICNASVPYNVKHPIILPPKSKFTKLIVRNYHLKYYHADATLLISLLKQQFWIIRCRDVVKEIVHNCINCFRARPKLQTQMMGDLPIHRVNMSHPFTKIGVDYAGPISISHYRGRGQKSFKAYICLYVCMATKAVHIELVHDLTSDSFLASLRRLINRRGRCTDIYSDCGSNFIGANNQLIEVFKFLKLNTNIIATSLLKENIQWHFNPPSAPHMGGLWESAVKSTKHHLTRVIGDTILTSEELQTLLVEIEGILNSRPLCVLADDQLDALTPAHLLIGRPITQLPEPNLKDEKINKLKRWEHLLYMKQHFWNRWHTEYLTSLQKRNKWFSPSENLNIGDIVIIKDENLPSTQWKYGLIENVHAGKDNLIRVATVKVKSGSMQRPIHKLCKLPSFD